jgi:hypothetical protein
MPIGSVSADLCTVLIMAVKHAGVALAKRLPPCGSAAASDVLELYRRRGDPFL